MTAQLHHWRALVTSWLPTGSTLSDSRWASRHRAMVWVLWLHLPALLCVGLLSPHGLHHVLPDIAALSLGASAATSPVFSRRVRTLAAVVTLVSCSAVLVHLTDGLTESHFHFFAVVAFITLYQEWLPFAVCLAYVVIHHGVLGVWAPAAVFSHHAAREHPVTWAMIHGGFVILASLASLAAWRLTDVERQNVERVLGAAGDGIYGVDSSGRITFVNPMLCELVGRDAGIPGGCPPPRSPGPRVGSGRMRRRARRTVPCARPSIARSPWTPTRCTCAVSVSCRCRSSTSSATCRAARTARAASSPSATCASGELSRRSAGRPSCSVTSWRRSRRRHPTSALIGRSDGRFVWLNLAGRRLLGFGDTEDITAYRIEDMFSAEEMARVYREDMPVLARDGDWQGEWALETRDGTQIPAWVTHHLHPEASEEHAYVTGTMRDLRKQRAEERQRRENELRLAAAEGVAGMGSWEWELSSDRVMWSPGMYRLYGMEEGNGEETYGAWVATLHPDDREQVVAEATESADTGIDITHRAIRADGREIVVHTRGELIMDEHGQPASMLGHDPRHHRAARRRGGAAPERGTGAKRRGHGRRRLRPVRRRRSSHRVERPGGAHLRPGPGRGRRPAAHAPGPGAPGSGGVRAPRRARAPSRAREPRATSGSR